VRAALAAVILIAACACGGQPQATISPAITPPSPSPTPSPSPSPSPQPFQRAEPSLPAAVEETAAAAAGGKLYVMGGFNAAGASLRSVYVFDGTSWTSGPALPLPLDHASAATLNDQVYIAGGHSNGRDSARAFRLDGSAWTELASLHYARGGHALIAAAGRLYAIGGNTAAGNVGPTESYDPSTGGWSVLDPLPSPRNHVLGFALDDTACVAGGRSPTTARIDCVLLTTGAWSRPFTDLPTPTSGGGAIAFPSGDVVVAGGQDASETRIVDQVDVLAGKSWTVPAHMLAPRHGFELALFGDRAWACGGGSAPGLHPVATCTSLGDWVASAS
jgi:hypothetical protein